MSRLPLVALLSLTIQACATASFRIPDNRFISPENSGELGDGIVTIGYGSKTNVTVAEGDLLTDNEVLSSNDLEKDDGIFTQLGVGLHPMAEIFFNTGALGAKFQFIGEPASTASKGNFSMAFALASDEGENSVTSSLAGDGTYTAKAVAKYNGIDAMLLTGYRVTEQQLLYANIASASYVAKGSITKEYTSGARAGTSNQIDIPKRNVRQTSLLLGWQALNSQAYLMVEGGYSIANMESTEALGRPTLGATLGIRW